MQTFFQLGTSPRPSPQRPAWLRVLALLCLMLLSVASTEQACHIHAEIAAKSSGSQDSRDSRQTVPDHCPLCVAMHSALPATAHTAPEPVLQIQAVLLQAVQTQRNQRWSYELFSRPPPAVPLQA